MPDTPTVYVLVYRQCGHRILATGDWDVAVRITERCSSVMVQEASDADLAELLPSDADLAGERAEGLRKLLTESAPKTSVLRNRPRDCWCRLNDAKVHGVWNRLTQAAIDGKNLDLVR